MIDILLKWLREAPTHRSFSVFLNGRNIYATAEYFTDGHKKKCIVSCDMSFIDTDITKDYVRGALERFDRENSPFYEENHEPT